MSLGNCPADHNCRYAACATWATPSKWGFAIDHPRPATTKTATKPATCPAA